MTYKQIIKQGFLLNEHVFYSIIGKDSVWRSTFFFALRNKMIYFDLSKMKAQ